MAAKNDPAVGSPTGLIVDPGGLDQLVPQAGASFAPAFLLAALRRDARAWLGGLRLGTVATALGLDEAAAVKALDKAPRPPPSLGDAAQWLGRSVPLLHRGRVAWSDLFWRPDPMQWQRGAGSFALRLRLPEIGPVEIRGRIDEGRLDAVLHVDQLSRRAAFEARQGFAATLRKLGLVGGLSVSSACENPPG